MEKEIRIKEISDVFALYSILCSGKKEVSIQYLDGISDLCKTEDEALRRTLFRERMRKLLSDS